MEFLHWITLYHGVVNNLYGKDRSEALEAMKDDEEFDRWMAAYETKKAVEGHDQSSSTNGITTAAKKAGTKMSKDNYIKQFNAEV